MREDFSELRLPSEVVNRFQPDRQALFDWVRAITSDAMIEVISGADYGNDQAAHFAALRRIRDGQNLDLPLEWVPREVLELYRWSMPDTQKEFSVEADFWIAKAFACAALLRCNDATENHGHTSADVAVHMVLAMLAVDNPPIDYVLRRLVWGMEHLDPWDEDFLYCGFCLVVCCHVWQLGSEAQLRQIREWWTRTEQEVLTNHTVMSPGARSFSELRYVSISLGQWHALAQRVLKLGPFEPDFEASLRAVRPRPPVRQVVETATLLVRVLPSALKYLRRPPRP